jgi:phosphoribosylaminoimidazole-succinocarboxamide synthase
MKKIASGKVREIYQVSDKELLIVTTNRISAFDNILKVQIPYKGEVLNKISLFWFDFLKDIIKNHIISDDVSKISPENVGNAVIVKKLKMIPVECVVRGYISGSSWQDYKETGTIFGKKYNVEFKESSKLPEPIFTPTTKADIGHDMNITFKEVENLIGSDIAKKIKDKTIEIYKKCSEYADTKEIIIADTKFEFGLNENNELVLADEVLTPDSSRFWDKNIYSVGKSQDSFDKQIVRDWLIEHNAKNNPDIDIPSEIVNKTSEKYIEVYKRLTGKNSL